MRHFYVATAILFGLALTSVPAWAGPKDDKILRLMTITGAADRSAQMADMMISQLLPVMRAANPGVKDQAWDILVTELRAEFNASVPGFLAVMAPIYDRHLTESELDDLIAFYETPSGRKLIAVLPQVAQESMVAGQQMGQIIGQRALQNAVAKLRKMGHQINM